MWRRAAVLAAFSWLLAFPLVAQREVTRRILRLASHRVDVVSLEEYVAAVLPGEIGGGAPTAALEAQAVAARSYGVARLGRHEDEGADLCDGTHCQVYRGRMASTETSRRAAQATAGMVLVQDGRVIAAPFHAVCGGRTTRPADVWDDEETPDLVAVDDEACLGSQGSVWTYHLKRTQLAALGERIGFPEAKFLEIYGRNADGRVTAVRLAAPGGRFRVLRGFDFRKEASALFGWDSVRSTAFELFETRSTYVLAGRGTGHGAGLCQHGAIARARRGETRNQILSLYYNGAKLMRLSEVLP